MYVSIDVSLTEVWWDMHKDECRYVFMILNRYSCNGQGIILLSFYAVVSSSLGLCLEECYNLARCK